MAAERQYCTFFVEDHYFGLDVLRVQEIIRYQEMTRVPLAPPVVRGLINLRGQIVTAIDLRRRLELKDRPADQQPVNVVVHAGKTQRVGLVVHRVLDIAEEDLLSRSPARRRGVLFTAVVQGRVTEFLDVEGIIRAADPGFFDQPHPVSAEV